MLFIRFAGLSSSRTTKQCGLRALYVPFLLLFLVTWSDAVSARAVERPFGQGVLWKIEDPESSAAPNYVFGTVHVTDRRILNLPMEVRKAFAHARVAVFEIKQRGSDRALYRDAVLLEPGHSLGDFLNGDQLRRLSKAAEMYGFEEHVLHRFKPWALYTMFSVPPSEAARRNSGNKVLDNSMQTRARDFGVPVYGLETLEEQLALFEGASDEEQTAYLDSVLRQLDGVEAGFESFLQLYLARDIDGIFDLSIESMEAADANAWESFQEVFLDRRNVNMVERMQEHLQEGGAFVAIGALHLPGEQGVLNLLQDQGYRLTRVY